MADHLEHGVLDLRVAALPGAYSTLLTRDLPLGSAETGSTSPASSHASPSCAREVAAEHPGDTIQHDDLHVNGVFVRDGTMRVMDWGDASIGHPFVSLIVTFRFLEEHNGLAPADPWFARLRDAYLEPWGPGLSGAFTRAMRVGAFAHAIAWLRHRDPLGPAERQAFDKEWAVVLRRALAGVAEPAP